MVVWRKCSRRAIDLQQNSWMANESRRKQPFRRLYPTTLVKTVWFLYTASETGTFKWKKDVRAYTEILETIDRPTEQWWTMMQSLRSRCAAWDVFISNVLRFAKARTFGSSERWEASIPFFYCRLGTPDVKFVRRWRIESKRMQKPENCSSGCYFDL